LTNPILQENPKRAAGAALVCVYLLSRFEARPKNLKIASAQPVTEYVDIIPDILPNTTSGKLRFLAWLRMDFELIIDLIFENFKPKVS